MLDRLTIERMLAKAGEGPILVALSGGGDSVALLHLLSSELRRRDLRAIIVNHRLREGSAEDAVRAASIAHAMGRPGHIEELKWDEGANRAHEAARGARYRALCAAARKCGARVIVTGHTRDDQAETVLLRAERGSGLRGLAAMRAFAPMPLWPEGRGLWLARPLLGARRQALRAYLLEHQLDWIEDPANENRIYARVRARSVLGELERQGIDTMRLAAVAERLQAVMERANRAASDLVTACVTFADDEIEIATERWNGDAFVRQRALQALVTVAGGSERGPGADDVAALEEAVRGPSFKATTIAGAMLRKRGGMIVLTRDRGALTGRADGTPGVAPLDLPQDQQVVWDRRLALVAPTAGWSVVVEGGAPVLVRGGQRASIETLAARWLLAERVQHLLSVD